MDAPVLYQFRISHYVEKVRWALDLKGVPHVRRTVLVGEHIPVMWLTSGQQLVPALRLDGEVIAGSADILALLEARFPEPRIFPASDQARQEAAELVRWLDDEVGPDIRRALYWEILRTPGWTSRLFSGGHPAWVQTIYAGMFHVLAQIMRVRMSVFAGPSARSLARLETALDRLAARVQATGYLVGDAFTVADLTAASLLYPLAFPPEFPYAAPEPRPSELVAWLARWEAHPMTAWVREIYRRHRPPGRAINEGMPTSA